LCWKSKGAGRGNPAYQQTRKRSGKAEFCRGTQHRLSLRTRASRAGSRRARLSRGIRKDRRIYFFDCAAAYDETGGSQLDNLVACGLLKYASDNNPSTSLRHYTEKLRPRESLQLVQNLDRAQERSGIKILPLGKWLEELPFQMNSA
jgi:hypothetical protein